MKEARDIHKNFKAAIGDNEAAHSLEDDLRDHVLRCVRDIAKDTGCNDTLELVELALSTSDERFDRWYV